jgi:hypothetical protein
VDLLSDGEGRSTARQIGPAKRGRQFSAIDGSLYVSSRADPTRARRRRRGPAVAAVCATGLRLAVRAARRSLPRPRGRVDGWVELAGALAVAGGPALIAYGTHRLGI